MFGFRLRVPASGDDITADWARELVKAVRSLRLHAGPGIRLTRTPDGTTVSADAFGGGFSAPAKPTAHFGNAEDAESRTEWEQTEEVPAILEIPDADGNVLVKILVDSRGNIISWTSADEEEPDDPAAPKDPPPCGHPLNDEDDSHPFGNGGGGGGAGGGPSETADGGHPLDYEGDGGFTPKCGDN